jgi:hypothetical protein
LRVSGISAISKTEGPALCDDRGIVKHQLMALAHPLNDSGAVTYATGPLSSLTAIRILVVLFASGTIAGGSLPSIQEPEICLHPSDVHTSPVPCPSSVFILQP